MLSVMGLKGRGLPWSKNNVPPPCQRDTCGSACSAPSGVSFRALPEEHESRPPSRQHHRKWIPSSPSTRHLHLLPEKWPPTATSFHPAAIAPPVATRISRCRRYLGAGLIHKCMIVPTGAHRSPHLTGNLNQPIIPVGIPVTPAGGGSGLTRGRPLAHYCAYFQTHVGGARIGVIEDLERTYSGNLKIWGAGLVHCVPL